jgi:hypothetical protein
MRMIRYTVMAAALAAAGSAQAFGLGVRAGTTGLGADIAWDIAPTLSARLGYSGGKVGYDVDTDQVRYEGDVKLSNLNALLDFAPLGPFFRISGGVVFNDNKYDVRGTSTSGVPGSLTGTVKSGKSAAPYLGIGYGRVSGTGVNFYADLGVIFQGTPSATLTADCTGLNGGQCSALQGQVAAEEARLQDELKNFKYYPVLNIGLTIGF